jgi:D-glycero-alpha-D-manno-heptose-7-phosphate kinase
MLLDDLQINENGLLKEALELISKNQKGIILVKDFNDSIIGLATDGDIREKILLGNTLSDKIGDICNKNFIWADDNTSREFLLKRLDNKIKLIPVLDINKKLIDIVTHNYFPTKREDAIYVRSKSPVRVSFGGGGSDLTHFFKAESGAVINATISIYSHALLKVREDDKIILESSDLNKRITFSNLNELLKDNSEFNLITSTIKTIQPDFGFELYTNSDFPMKSGLGGSAAVSAAVLGCFNQLRTDKYNSYDLSELAYQAERIYQGIAGGWQDQYATIFGGINFIEFNYNKNQIYPLRINNDIINELEENLILCYTGENHESGEVHDNQKKKMEDSDVRDFVKKNVALTYEIRDHLLRGNLNEFAKCLHQAWEYKKKFGDNITNPRFNNLYDFARSNGAIGGKLLGAGGGGFFLFYCNPFRKQNLIKCLIEKGHEVRNFKFEPDGLKSWVIRDNEIKL